MVEKILVIHSACNWARQNFEGKREQVEGLRASTLVWMKAERCLPVLASDVNGVSRRLGAEDRVEVAMFEVLDRHLEKNVQLKAVKGMKCAVMMNLEDGLQSEMVVGR
jgi:hypothetical protein